MTKPKLIRRAEIIHVHLDFTEKDEWGYTRRYAGQVTARDETGQTHIFVNGSFNRVHNAQVGDTGTVEYVNSGSMALWYFRKDKPSTATTV